MADEKRIFAKRLNYYMDRNGKSQTDLINDLGINKSTVSTWCNGAKMPRMGTIQTLADYFGIMKSDLIEEKPANNSELSKIKKDFIALIDTLDDQQVERVMELVQTALRLGEK